MYDALVRSIVFPIHEWLKGHSTEAALREAREFDRMSSADVEAAQLTKLRRMIEHAGRHTEYYREAFGAAGVGADDLATTADLRRFPLLDRD